MPEKETSFPIPLEASEQIETRQAQYAARWGELDRANWPPGRIKEKLDKEFPDLRTSAQIEQEEVEQILASAGPAPTRKPKPLGPRQLNIADGDKRVGDEYPDA